MKLKMIALVLAAFTAGYAQNTKKTVKPAQPDGIFAEMETSKGKIVLELEYKKTPVTVASFVSLAEGTNTYVSEEFKAKPFFNGIKFHRVIPNFMIQGGDPTASGMGGPGYKFKDEFTDLKHDSAGILSMANSGPTTNGSQFFITHNATPHLDGKHTVFGRVVTGQDVVNAIVKDDMINKLTIVRRGADAKAFDAPRVFADYYANKAEEDRKMAEAEAAKRREHDLKYAAVKKAKVDELAKIRAGATKLPSGLEYKIVKASGGKKPAAGTPVYIHYAGFLEDGSLFDSSIATVNEQYGRLDPNRAAQNGYPPLPFTAGKKDGLIPGFIEAIEQMAIGDKLVAFIPSNLAYGARGAGNVIPPNSNIIFEMELLDKN